MIKPVIALTRDAEGNEKLSSLLKVAPEQIRQFALFNNVPSNAVDITLGKHIIVTSRHAAAFCAKLDIEPQTQFYAVGNETAKMLEKLPGKVAVVADDVSKLIKRITNEGVPEYTYLRGRHVSVDLNEELTNSGIVVNEQIVYEYKLDETTLEQVERFAVGMQSPIIFPLLSARTAQILCEAVFKHRPVSPIHAVVLSSPLCELINNYPWSGIHVAEQPHINALAKACLNCFDSISLK